MKTLSTKQAAQILDKTEQFVRIGLQQGILPYFKDWRMYEADK